MHQRELTPQEEADLSNEIGLFATACGRKKEFLDRLMLATSLIQAGDLIYAMSADESKVAVLGVVYKLERPYAEKQLFQLDNTPHCNYVYAGSNAGYENLFFPGLEPVASSNPSRTYNTSDRNHPTVFRRDQVVAKKGEAYVVEMEEAFHKDNPWAKEFIQRFKIPN
jgi:hypothetical protein